MKEQADAKIEIGNEETEINKQNERAFWNLSGWVNNVVLYRQTDGFETNTNEIWNLI